MAHGQDDLLRSKYTHWLFLSERRGTDREAFAFAFAFTCAVTSAAAGGLDQSGQPVTLLFRDGNHVEVARRLLGPDRRGQ